MVQFPLININQIFFTPVFSGTVKRGGPPGDRSFAVGTGAHLRNVQRVEGQQCAFGAGHLSQTGPAGGVGGHTSCSISHCCSSGGDQFIKTPPGWFYWVWPREDFTHFGAMHTLLFSIETTVPYQQTLNTNRQVTGSMKKCLFFKFLNVYNAGIYIISR